MRKVSRQLRRALRTCAPKRRAVLITLHGCAADRTPVRQEIRRGSLRPLFWHDLENFGDDLPCLADFDRVSDADILLGDEVLIMKRCCRNRRSRQVHRRDNGPGRQYPCSPNLYDDVLQDSLLDLGRIFERRRPAGEFGRAAQGVPVGQAVQLDDGTVDIKFYNLGYVVFAVSTNRVSAADAATSTSPKTGRPLYPFWLLAAAAALAAGTAIMVAVLPKRKKG